MMKYERRLFIDPKIRGNELVLKMSMANRNQCPASVIDGSIKAIRVLKIDLVFSNAYYL
jgi:hypothetical protein